MDFNLMSLSLNTIRTLSPVVQVEEFAGRGLGIEKLRSIQFATKYGFRVWFDPTTLPPAQFAGEIPAVDVSVEEAVVENQTQEFFMSNYQFPLGSRAKTIALSFYDDEYHVLFNWFKSWINVDILNLGSFISCINDKHQRLQGIGSVKPVRKMFIEKLDAREQVIDLGIYDVLPTGEMTFTGSNSSEPQIHNMNFVIVRDNKYQPPTKNSFVNAASGVLDLTKQFGSRFF